MPISVICWLNFITPPANFARLGRPIVHHDLGGVLMYHGLLNVASASLTTLFQARLQKIPYVPIQTLSTCISPQNAANRHGRSSQPCLVVPLHVVRVTRVARPHMSSMVTRVTRVTRPRARARSARALDRCVQHARGRARATRVTHAHRKHGR